MDEMNYNNLDIYGKLKFMNYICWDVKKGLEGIVNRYQAQDYIDELMDTLMEYFNIFSKDNELNKEENFGEDFKYFSFGMKEVMDIVPLIKSGEADYTYLIDMLSSLVAIIESALPNNVRLARFFQRLLNCKKEFAERLDINEDEFDNVIGKMMSDVDAINDILTNNNEKRGKTR